jgi:hypothetical protein
MPMAGCSWPPPRGGVMRDGVVVIPRLHPSMSVGPVRPGPGGGRARRSSVRRGSALGVPGVARGFPLEPFSRHPSSFSSFAAGAGAAPRPFLPRPSISRACPMFYVETRHHRDRVTRSRADRPVHPPACIEYDGKAFAAVRPGDELRGCGTERGRAGRNSSAGAGFTGARRLWAMKRARAAPWMEDGAGDHEPGRRAISSSG